eukprot:gene19696-26387_t
MESEEAAWSLIGALRECNIGDGAPNLVECSNHACRSADVTLQDSSYICNKCGTMMDRFIDQGAEWRYFGNNDTKGKDPSRCGMPNSDLLPEGSLSTYVGMSSGKCNKNLMRITRYQLWNSMPYKERSLFNAIEHLTVKAVNCGVCPSIIDEAKVLYKRVFEMQLSRGDNRTGLLASSIYIVCKNNKVPRSAKEIADMFHVKTTTITRNCKKFQELMNIKLESSLPSDYVSRFCSQLQIDQDLQSICIKVVQRIQENKLMTDNSPPSIVAGTIYFVCAQHNVSVAKKLIADTCGVSEVTVNKCYKTIFGMKDFLCQ